MKLKVYVIKDTASGHATALFTANNEKVLERNLVIMFQQKQINMLNDHPEDKQVFEIASYDTETMIIEPVAPNLVITGSEVEEKVISALRQYKQRYDDLLSDKQKEEIKNEIARNKGEIARDV